MSSVDFLRFAPIAVLAVLAALNVPPASPASSAPPAGVRQERRDQAHAGSADYRYSGGIYKKELQYLTSRGYTWERQDSYWLVAKG